MIMSMTGYGSHKIELDKLSISVEIKTVNNRFLDIVIKQPRSLLSLEQDFNLLLKEHFNRGRIEVFITVIGQESNHRSLQVDWALLDQYMESLAQIKDRYELEGNIPMTIIPTFENLFDTIENNQLSEQVQEALFTCLKHACKTAVASRNKEGVYLIKDIQLHINETERMIQELKTKQSIVYQSYKDRIKQRIEQHVGEEIKVDDVQLLHEIALLAEKGDITEEITRLESHIIHFNSVMQSSEVIGRKLDFILQEMHREVNTIGAKSIDKETNKYVVQLKSHIEKIKEQVQNVE